MGIYCLAPLLTLPRYLRDLELKAKAYDDALAAASSQGLASVPVPTRSRQPTQAAVDEDDEEILDGNALLEVFRRMDFHDAGSRPLTSEWLSILAVTQLLTNTSACSQTPGGASRAPATPTCFCAASADYPA